MKGTTEDILRDRSLWYGIARHEADTLRAALHACDSTLHDLRTVAGNDSSMRAQCEDQYRDLDRRTVRKSALPWYVLAGALLGFLLSR